jgi:hypothetical protein
LPAKNIEMPSIEPRAATARETVCIATPDELEAECIRQLETRTEPATICDWQDELADRAEKHIMWHIARGEERRVNGPLVEAAQEAMLDALTDIADATDDTERDAAFSNAHETLSDWKYEAECDAGREDIRGAAYYQCVELDQGEIREILRSMADLEWLSRGERDGAMTPMQVAIDLAAIGFAAPSCPPHGAN